MFKNFLKLIEKSPSAPLPEYKKYSCRNSSENPPQNPEILWYRTLNTNFPGREKAFAFLWHDQKSIHVAAVMEDSNVYTDAAPKNDKTWEKGDVMEFFFQAPGHKNYYELHIAPNGATLQLSIPSVEQLGIVKFENTFFESGMDTAFETFSIPSGINGWCGRISIPLKSIDVNSVSDLTGSRFSVCRYNYNSAWGKEPEISSSAYFPVRGFHQPHCWTEIINCN